MKKSLTLRGSILPFDLSENYFSDGIKKMENRWNKCSKHNITLYKKKQLKQIVFIPKEVTLHSTSKHIFNILYIN